MTEPLDVLVFYVPVADTDDVLAALRTDPPAQRPAALTDRSAP